MTRVVASIEARMSSQRLPGKVLADLGGRPTLGRILDRLRRVRRLDGILLATTTSPLDDPVAAWAEAEGIDLFRGDEEDVLGRVVAAHERIGSSVIVEVTGDTPFLDPAVIDRGIAAYLEGGWDVVTTVRVPSYPDGIDVQVFGARLLAEVARNVFDPEVREHVSLYFYRHPERYRILDLEAPPELARADLALLLDTPEDLVRARAIYAALEPIHGGTFGLAEILSLLAERPDLCAPRS